MELNEFYKFFQDNPILNIIFLILALLSFLSSVFFYLKSIRRKDPAYSIRTINLVKDKVNKIKGLEIKYQNEKISNLSISKIALYNNGKETIKSSDIAKNAPITIEIEKTLKILDASIIFEKNKANNFNIDHKNNKIIINFDYFDYNEGIVVQVVHTGKSSKDLSISGSIHGVKSIKEKSINKSLISRILLIYQDNSKKLFSKHNYKFILFILFVTPIAFFLIQFIPDKTEKSDIRIIELFFGIISLILYWGLAITIIKNMPPKGFDIFNDEFLNENSKSA